MTFSDWTFTNGDPSLDNSTYVSSPSSLRLKLEPSSFAYMYAISKNAGVQALVNGQIIDNWRINSVSANYIVQPHYYFRFQDVNNYYLINLDCRTGIQKISLNKNVAGVNTVIDTRSFTFTPAVNTWYKFRITFWEVASVLYVRVEWWNGATWVAQGADMDHYPPLFISGGKVGVGGNFGETVGGPYYVWHDDTELWG